MARGGIKLSLVWDLMDKVFVWVVSIRWVFVCCEAQGNGHPHLHTYS